MTNFISPETVLVVHEKTVNLSGTPARSLTPIETLQAAERRGLEYSKTRRRTIQERVREEQKSGKDTRKEQSSSSMAQLRYIQETPSRRAVFKDLWELQGVRPTPVEVDRKYRQMSCHLSYAMQNRQQANSFQQERKNRKGKRSSSTTVLQPLASQAKTHQEEVMELRQKTMSDFRKTANNVEKQVERRAQETTAELPPPSKVSDQLQIFTYLSDDSDDDEPSAADMHALAFWQRRYEDQQLVKKAFTRSKAHKKEAVETLMRNLPQGTPTGVSLPGQYVPFKLNKFT